VVDRRHEVENLRRSLAMLTPGTAASLSREEAMALVSELAQVQARGRTLLEARAWTLAELE
jgi:hypothetical protein